MIYKDFRKLCSVKLHTGIMFSLPLKSINYKVLKSSQVRYFMYVGVIRYLYIMNRIETYYVKIHPVETWLTFPEKV